MKYNAPINIQLIMRQVDALRIYSCIMNESVINTEYFELPNTTIITPIFSQTGGIAAAIVAAYVSKNSVPAAELLALISSVHAALEKLGAPAAPTIENKPNPSERQAEWFRNRPTAAHDTAGGVYARSLCRRR